MTQGDMETFVMSLFYSGQNDLANENAEAFLAYYPHSLMLNRIYFRSLVPLKKYKEAIDAYDNLKKADNPIIEIRDTMAYATALVGIKKYDEAMVLYDKVLRKPNISSRDLEATNIYINQCMAARIKDYTSNGNYQQAIDMYKSFLDKREAENLVTDDMRMNYANIYMDWADELNGPEKIEKLMEADRILEDAANKSKDNDAYFAYIRMVKIYYTIDGRAESGAGIPCVEQLERIVMSKGGDISGTNANRLVAAYNYAMGYYYVTKDDNAMGLKYAEKILSIDPMNEKAQKVKEIAERQLGRRRRR
jgi:tetratricopeptide (TPR) repeat protein